MGRRTDTFVFVVAVAKTEYSAMLTLSKTEAQRSWLTLCRERWTVLCSHQRMSAEAIVLRLVSVHKMVFEWIQNCEWIRRRPANIATQRAIPNAESVYIIDSQRHAVAFWQKGGMHGGAPKFQPVGKLLLSENRLPKIQNLWLKMTHFRAI